MQLSKDADRTLPEEEVTVQELFCADIIQREHRVDVEEQSAEDGDQLQALQARLPARQRPRARLSQPIGVGLETEKWAFGGMKGQIKER